MGEVGDVLAGQRAACGNDFLKAGSPPRFEDGERAAAGGRDGQDPLGAFGLGLCDARECEHPMGDAPGIGVLVR